MSKKIRLIFAISAMALVMIVIYIFIHESGHAIIAIYCGAQITRLSILEAHVWWSGGYFTTDTMSLCNAAGALLPICVSLIGIFLYRKNIKNPIYNLAYPYFIVISTASLSIWVLLPILSKFTTLPDTDDAAKFLKNSGFSPIIVSLIAAVLILLTLFLANTKGMFKNLIHTMRFIMNDKTDGSTYLSKKVIAGLTAVVLTVIITAVLFELPDIMTKPIISISTAGENTITDFQKNFDVRRGKDYNFDVQLDAEGLLTDIRILDSERKVIYQALNEKASAKGTIYLNPGAYTISVIYLEDIDTFERYCEEKD